MFFIWHLAAPPVYLLPSLGRKWNLHLEFSPTAWQGSVKMDTLAVGDQHALEMLILLYISFLWVPPTAIVPHNAYCVWVPLGDFQPMKGAVGWPLWASTSGSWHCGDLGHLPLCENECSLGIGSWILLLNIITCFFMHLLKWQYHFPFFFCWWGKLHELIFKCYNIFVFYNKVCLIVNLLFFIHTSIWLAIVHLGILPLCLRDRLVCNLLVLPCQILESRLSYFHKRVVIAPSFSLL